MITKRLSLTPPCMEGSEMSLIAFAPSHSVEVKGWVGII